jgi:hypothetical protein
VRQQYQAFAGLSLALLGLTELGFLIDKHLFQTYFADAHPLLVVLLLVLLGTLLMIFLISRHSFVVFSNTTARDLLIGFSLTASFALIAILIDINVKFPASMNILFPESLLFYPVIGFCVEIVFHLLPLSILMLIFGWLFPQAERTKFLWLSLAIVSLIEPAFQAISGFSERVPLWVLVWIGFHVFLINLVQLLIFKRNGFVWMYLFRLVYYAFWHVTWGFFRLRILY